MTLLTYVKVIPPSPHVVRIEVREDAVAKRCGHLQLSSGLGTGLLLSSSPLLLLLLLLLLALGLAEGQTHATHWRGLLQVGH